MRALRYASATLSLAGLLGIVAVYLTLTPAISQVTITTSPAITTTALSTTSAQIIGTNPTRQGIIICNPSTIIEWIAPAPATAVANAGVGLPAVATGTTVCFSIIPSGSSSGTVGNAWNAISASGTPNITVIEIF